MTHYAAPLALNMPLFNSGDYSLSALSTPEFPGYPLPAFMSGSITSVTQSAATTIFTSAQLQALDTGTYIFCMSADVGLSSYVQGLIMFTVYKSGAGSTTAIIGQTYYTGSVETGATPATNSVCIYNIAQSPAAIQVYNSFATANSNLNWTIIRF